MKYKWKILFSVFIITTLVTFLFIIKPNEKGQQVFESVKHLPKGTEKPQHKKVEKNYLTKEEQLTLSAKKVINSWTALLHNKPYLAVLGGDDYWGVTWFNLVDNSVGFDIKKTESIISPYLLIISFQVLKSSNFTSPNANYLTDKSKYFGFKTKEDAMANTKEIDFSQSFYARGIYKVIIYYSLTENNWILNGGNEDFDRLFKGCHGYGCLGSYKNYNDNYKDDVAELYTFTAFNN